MRKKSVFDYFVLGLFILGMGFALSAALYFSTVARERQFMVLGRFLLILLGGSAALAIVMLLRKRVVGKVSLFWGNAISVLCFLGILLLGYLLRMNVINRIELLPASDFETYYNLGAMLAKGELALPENIYYQEYVAKFPHTIGYPLLVLSPVFSLFGESVRAALSANLAFSMGSIVLVYFIMRQIGASRFVRFVGMLLMAVWPSHVLYASMVASEPTFTFLVLLAFLLFAIIAKREPGALSDRHPVIAEMLLFLLGVVLAAAGAVRPMAQVLVIALVIVFLMQTRLKLSVHIGAAKFILAKGWACALLMLAAYFLTSTIITRNVADQIQMTPVSGVTASGYNLMVGTNTGHGGVWNQEDADFFSSAFEETQSASEAHSRSMEVAIQRLREKPLEELNLFVYKYRDLWQSDDFGIDWNILWLEQQESIVPELRTWLESFRDPGRLLYMAVLLYALIAAVMQWLGKRRVEPAFYVCMLFFIGTALLHMLLETQVRYHYNMIPFLIIMSGYTLIAWEGNMAKEPEHETESLMTPEERMWNEAIRSAPSPDIPVPNAVDALPLRFSAEDLSSAIREGHVVVTLSQASAKNAAAPEKPGEEGAPDAEESRESPS